MSKICTLEQTPANVIQSEKYFQYMYMLLPCLIVDILQLLILSISGILQ